MRPVFLALLLAPAAACGGESAPDHPNVILISLDAVRADHTGFLGYERDTTPNLDRLAEESISFTRAYATAPMTLVSHMGMMTGLRQSRHGVDKDQALSPDIPTLAERLAAIGYDTIALFFKGWIHERFGYDRGFRVFQPHPDWRGAAAHMDEHFAQPTTEPFFLFLHLFDAHSADLRKRGSTMYEAPAPFDTMFQADATDVLAAAAAQGMTAHALWNGGMKATPEVIEAATALYDGAIANLDHQVGAWLDRFAQQGILDNSIVIVTADHGESLGQRGGEMRGHGDMFEEGLRVPLLVRLPGGRKGGLEVTTPVSHVDIVPTVLEATGLDLDPWLEGTSLTDRQKPGRLVWSEMNGNIAVYRWPWKLRAELNAPGGVLVNLETDPRELSPMTRRTDPRAYDRLRDGLVTAMERDIAGRPDPGATAVVAGAATAAETAELRALGYLEETE